MAADPRIGTKIAGYRIERLLGRGGMSAVYLAYDPGLDRRVALKLMSPELSEDEGFRERFRVEWRRAASIEHPNVVPVYDAAEAGGQLYIAMRYIEGTDLKTLLETEGVLEPERALRLLAQTAAGLDAAHDKGLVHRDVKPSNVLVSFDRDGEHAYLADFGLTKPASTAEEARESIQLSGTTDYVSPEQIADGTADAQSDLYALGALLYESLTGDVPYPKERKLQVLFAHVNDPPPRPTEVKRELPEAIDSVIATAMAKEPENRYETGADLAEAARTALGLDQPRFTRRRLLLLASATALAGAAVAAVPAIVLTRGGGETSSESFLPLTSDSLIRIDPEHNEIVAAQPLPGSPALLALNANSVWVAATNEKKLLNADPSTGALVEEIDVSQAGRPAAIAAGPDTVWLGNPSEDVIADQAGGPLWKYDVRQHLLEEAVANEQIEQAFGGVDHGLPGGLLLTREALWAGCDITFRIDPSTGALVAQIDTPTAFMAVGGDSVWTVEAAFYTGLPPETSRIHRIDPSTNEIAQSIDVEFFVTGMAWAEGALWVANGDQDAVTMIDPSSGAPTGSVRVGRSPSVVANGSGAIWVGSDRDGTVTRVDPATLNVSTIDVGGTAGDIAAHGDGVWVTVRP